jgi:hypothetical protein
MQMDTEDITILEMVEQHEIPCDYMGDTICPGGVAKWVMFKCCPECSTHSACLACETCKEARMRSDMGVVCKPGCGEIVAPARHMYTRVEPL